jgi:hypothetical protein
MKHKTHPPAAAAAAPIAAAAAVLHLDDALPLNTPIFWYAARHSQASLHKIVVKGYRPQFHQHTNLGRRKQKN